MGYPTLQWKKQDELDTAFSSPYPKGGLRGIWVVYSNPP
jgi:hypothetical protein